MSRYTQKINKVFQFEGDDVKVRYTRLKRKKAFQVTAKLPKGVGADNIREAVSITDALDVMEIMADYLPDQVVHFEGLSDADGNPVTLEEALDEAYFTELVADIALAIFEDSFPAGGDEGVKKSEPPSESTGEA